MDKKEYHSRSNNHSKELGGRRNHITGWNMQEQYQGAGSSERTRKGWRTGMERQWNCLYKRKNLHFK